MWIKQRVENGRMTISVLGYSESAIDREYDSESWEFFEYVASEIIRSLGGELEKANGPDSCRWILNLDTTNVVLDYDDVVGTTVSIEVGEAGSSKIAERVCQELEKL